MKMIIVFFCVKYRLLGVNESTSVLDKFSSLGLLAIITIYVQIITLYTSDTKYQYNHAVMVDNVIPPNCRFFPCRLAMTVVAAWGKFYTIPYEHS